MASSETAGGRPGRAWSAPSSSCLGPCSRSLSSANTPSPRLPHAYDNIASFGVYPELPASFGVYLTRCSRAKMYQAPTPLFSVGSKVIRNKLCARRRGSLGTGLVYFTGFIWWCIFFSGFDICSLLYVGKCCIL